VISFWAKTEAVLDIVGLMSTTVRFWNQMTADFLSFGVVFGFVRENFPVVPLWEIGDPPARKNLLRRKNPGE
jgi:hypothetical protein